MKKFLLSIIAVLFTATSFADVLNLPIDTDDALASGWSSSYSGETKTITYESAWSGRGWWLDADYSAYNYVVADVEATTAYAKLIVEYGDGTNSVAEGQAGTTQFIVPLNETAKSSIKQIYIQSGSANTITLKDAYFSTEIAGYDPNLIWEGTVKAGTDWNWDGTLGISGGAFSNMKDGQGLNIQYTVDGDAEYASTKAMLNQWGGDATTLLPSLAEYLNPDGFYTINDLASTGYVLPLTSDELAKLKANGLRLQSYNLTITKVIAVDADKVAEILATMKKYEVSHDPIYVIGDLEGSSWDPSSSAIQLSWDSANSEYVGVINVINSWDGNGWFGLSTTLSETSDDWTTFNSARLSVSADWGTIGTKGTLTVGADASFKLAAGTYTIHVDLENNTILIESGDTGVKSVSVSSIPVAYYTTSGAKLNSTVKGINIVKMADGQVKKVLVK